MGARVQWQPHTFIQIDVKVYIIFINRPFLACLILSAISSILPYWCMFLNIWVGNPESSLLYLIFQIRSLYLVLKECPVWPLYDFWRSKRASSYMPV
jgi:hypothetical protein